MQQCSSTTVGYVASNRGISDDNGTNVSLSQLLWIQRHLFHSLGKSQLKWVNLDLSKLYQRCKNYLCWQIRPGGRIGYGVH